MMTLKHKAFLFSTTALASFFAGSVPAHADVVLTFVRETSGSLMPQRPQRADDNSGAVEAPQPTTPPKQTVTVQIKGALARVEFRPLGAKPETVPTTVLLYDGMGQKVYTLDPAAKTYVAQSYKEAVDGEAPSTANSSAASRMTFKSSVDLKAARANNDFVSKEILGTKTRQYLVSGSSEMQLNFGQSRLPYGAPQGGTPQPGVSRGTSLPQGTVVYPSTGTITVAPQGNGGGAPGGWRVRRQGGQGGPGSGFTPPSLAVSGEIWSTNGASLFTAGRDTPVAAIYRLMLPENAGPFGSGLIKPLVTRLKNMKALPGESTVTFQMNAAFRDTGSGEGAPAAQAPLTTRLLMKEMNADATLEDTLFTIPTDFKEAQPPVAQFNRPGGNRDFGGRRFGGSQENE